jgi:hypothetical protein
VIVIKEWFHSEREINVKFNFQSTIRVAVHAEEQKTLAALSPLVLLGWSPYKFVNIWIPFPLHCSVILETE